MKAVFWESKKGPLAGMDNEKWKSVRRSDDLIRTYMSGDAGKLLAEEARGLERDLRPRLRLRNARRSRSPSTEKTDAYFFNGQPRFDVPFTTAMTWQGPPELDADSDAHDVQIAAPVLSGASRSASSSWASTSRSSRRRSASRGAKEIP